MKNGGITIEKVHESFSELNIVDTDFKGFEEKQPINVAEAAVIEWVLKTTADTEAFFGALLTETGILQTSRMKLKH